MVRQKGKSLLYLKGFTITSGQRFLTLFEMTINYLHHNPSTPQPIITDCHSERSEESSAVYQSKRKEPP